MPIKVASSSNLNKHGVLRLPKHWFQRWSYLCHKTQLASNVLISNTYRDVNSNRAEVNGGAIYLEQIHSKIYLQKQQAEFWNTLPNVRLNFINNSAEKGGAIYV